MFSKHKYLDASERVKTAQSLNLSETQVRCIFSCIIIIIIYFVPHWYSMIVETIGYGHVSNRILSLCHGGSDLVSESQDETEAWASGIEGWIYAPRFVPRPLPSTSFASLPLQRTARDFPGSSSRVNPARDRSHPCSCPRHPAPAAHSSALPPHDPHAPLLLDFTKIPRQIYMKYIFLYSFFSLLFVCAIYVYVFVCTVLYRGLSRHCIEFYGIKSFIYWELNVFVSKWLLLSFVGSITLTLIKNN